MIGFISSWAQGIVIAVVIGTIIEMILPEGNNKKYVKTIIGVYILFTMIVPVINKFTTEPLKLDIGKYEKILETSSEIKNIDERVNINIKNVYKENLENDIEKKINEKNYDVIKIELELEFEDSNKYGNINKMHLNIKKRNSDNSKIRKIENIEIDPNIEIEEELEEVISTDERTNLKKYLSEEYQVEEKMIIIF